MCSVRTRGVLPNLVNKFLIKTHSTDRSVISRYKSTFVPLQIPTIKISYNPQQTRMWLEHLHKIGLMPVIKCN